MKFQIEKVTSDSRVFTLSKGNVSEQNTYTIITGKNSSGKSRLLSKVVNSFIFSKDDSALLASGSITSPESPRII